MPARLWRGERAALDPLGVSLVARGGRAASPRRRSDGRGRVDRPGRAAGSRCADSTGHSAQSGDEERGGSAAVGGARARRHRARRRRRRGRRRSCSARAAMRPSGAPRPNPAVPAAAFLAAWHAGDYTAMYELVAPGVRASTTYHRFAHEYRAVARTASMTGVRAAGRLRATARHATVAGLGRRRPCSDASGGSLEIPLVLVQQGHTGSPGRRRSTFPGLRPGETLDAQGARTGGARAHPGPRRDGARGGPARKPHLSRGHGVCARHRVHQGAGGAGDRRPAQGRVAGRAEVRPGRASRSRSTRSWAAFPGCGWWRRPRPPGAPAGSWPGSRGGSRRTS